VRLIYEDIAEKLLTSNRFLKYQKWVEEAEKARKTGSFDPKRNQYDKAEELITFYTFAPLAHENVPDNAKKKVVQEILSSVAIEESVGKVKLHLEKDLPPPDSYLQWLRNEVRYHPIRYIRKEAGTKRVLEGYTQVDAIMETNNLLILIEVKFTSDISPYTKFGLIRNQFARSIDAGIYKAQRLHKKLIALLCTPSELYQRRSRFYYYKMQEYSDFSNVQKDILWRTINEIKETLSKVEWISLEDVIKIVYQNTKEHLGPCVKEVDEFFKERGLK